MSAPVVIVPAEEAVGRHLPLKLRRVMLDLTVSTRWLGSQAGLSAGSISMLASNGHFPKRCAVNELKARIVAALVEKGATTEQLQDLFEHYDHLPKGPRSTAMPRSPRKPKPEEEPPMLATKQTLSDAARKAFGLFLNPFDGEVTNHEELFQNGEIRFVREAAWQAVKNGRFVAVVGESGAGKTTVLEDLKERIQADGQRSIVIEPSMLCSEDNESNGKKVKSDDMVIALLKTMDPQGTVSQKSELRTRAALQLLEHSTMTGNSHVVLVEEAHSLSIPTLRHLKRLHEKMRLGRRPLLGILLLAHEREFRAKLSRHDTREVMQRCEIVQLPPLGNLSFQQYLEHKAKCGGRSLADFATQDGVDALYDRLVVQEPGGRKVNLHYPLNVNNWMTAALNAAAEIGAPRVDRAVIQAM